MVRRFNPFDPEGPLTLFESTSRGVNFFTMLGEPRDSYTYLSQEEYDKKKLLEAAAEKKISVVKDSVEKASVYFGEGLPKEFTSIDHMRLNFKDPATEIMEGIIDFHHDIQFYLIIIVSFVCWMLYQIVVDFGLSRYFQKNKPIDFSSDIKEGEDGLLVEETLLSRREHLLTYNVVHGTILEIVWTIAPAFILVAIAVPSFALLYAIDEVIEPTLTIKVVGHQWYWSYEYSDYEKGDLMFDSYMVNEENLSEGRLRLLEVDRKLWLPTYTHIRVLVTSADVIHSWAVPSLGVKMDALPGRLNQISMFIKREGLFFGQCSELCGVNHGFMPIAVKAVPIELFNFWVNFNLEDL